MSDFPDNDDTAAGGHSVTNWLRGMATGDRRAAGDLVARYFPRIVRAAGQRLGTSNRRVADEEDVAVSVFAHFCDAVADGKLPVIESRNDLWRLLMRITSRKATDLIRHQNRQKRGGGALRGESLFADSDGEQGNLGEVAADLLPTPEVAAEAAEQFEQLLAGLPDETFRDIATWKMAGRTNQEIAEELGIAERSVERKLARIRAIWQESDKPSSS